VKKILAAIAIIYFIVGTYCICAAYKIGHFDGFVAGTRDGFESMRQNCCNAGKELQEAVWCSK